MNHHLFWLWLWFGIGMLMYMAKRAFYLITGPNPVANNLWQFLKVAGVPLLFRAVVESGIYWAAFNPEVGQKFLTYLGWDSFAWVVSVITQFAVCALFFGLFVDVVADFVIGVLFNKIPGLKGWWPQMPSPMDPTKPNGSTPDV